MKLKYFLRGLGVGMVVTALVLCIAYRNSSSGKSVVEQAKELGMVFPQGTSEPDVTATPESENTKKPKSTQKAATKEPAKESVRDEETGGSQWGRCQCGSGKSDQKADKEAEDNSGFGGNCESGRQLDFQYGSERTGEERSRKKCVPI